MEIKIKLFALGRDLIGKNELSLTLNEDATVELAIKALTDEYPQFSSLTTFMVAVNQEYADRQKTLQNGDELAIIPPVSGG
jgi:molybdopterin converting factor subunit 1